MRQNGIFLPGASKDPDLIKSQKKNSKYKGDFLFINYELEKYILVLF